MRCEKCPLALSKQALRNPPWPVPDRPVFHFENIGGVAANVILLERLRHRHFIDNRAAANIDEPRSALHTPRRVGTDEVK